MAASETVRVRLHFDYPPPASPNCSSFWLLVDLTRCRVVTDLISLIRQRFGYSSGALLGLYLDGGLLPPTESARLVRDNDCLRIKLEERGVTENPIVVSNGDGGQLIPRKAKRRAFKSEEDEESELDCKTAKKLCKRQENSKSNENNLAPEPKSSTGHRVRKKNKKKKTAGQGVDDDGNKEDEETQRKTPKKKEKREYKKRTKQLKSPKAQTVKQWTVQNLGSSNSAHARNSPKGKTKGGMDSCTKGSPSSDSDSESASERLGNAVSENTPAKIAREGPPAKHATASRVAAKPGFPSTPAPGKSSGTSSSDSDSNSDSDCRSMTSKISRKSTLQTVGLLAGRACPGQRSSMQISNPATWKYSDANGGPQVLSPPPNVTLPSALGRGRGWGEDFLPWKGARGRGMRGRGRGRGFPNVLNRNAENVKQQQLNETVTNSSVIIQNPVEMPKSEDSLFPPPRDYSLLPLLAAAPQVGEKIAFKLLELALDYSPGVSEYKEGKILSHNPETQQVDIEILSSLPAMKEPGKFDLVYHNENGTEVVEYAVTQEKKITVFWRELIDPRLIIESPNNKSSQNSA